MLTSVNERRRTSLSTQLNALDKLMQQVEVMYGRGVRVDQTIRVGLTVRLDLTAHKFTFTFISLNFA